MEIIGIKYRELFSVVYQIPFNLGHLTLPLFAYFLRDWHDFQFALSIPSVILLTYFWFIPESPRWLFTMGRVEDATKLLEKAAHTNGKSTDNIRIDLAKVNFDAVNKSKFLIENISKRCKKEKLKLVPKEISSIFSVQKIYE